MPLRTSRGQSDPDLTVAIEGIPWTPAQSRRISLQQRSGPYSQAVIAGGFVFCSGTAGIDPVTGEIADGIEAQTEQALRNLAAILDEAGSSCETS